MESNWRQTSIDIGGSYLWTTNPVQVYPATDLASYWYTSAFRKYYLTNTVFNGQPIVLGIPLDTSEWSMDRTYGPLVFGQHFPYGLPVDPD